MDPESLVRDRAKVMVDVGQAFADAGLHVEEVYLIKTTTVDDFVYWHLRLVTDDDGREVIYKLVRLRRDGGLPPLDDELRVEAIRPSSYEASRILKYAARVPQRPLFIKNTPIDGLYVEYAVVAGLKERRMAA
ncbi:MAG: hypothetical protein QOH98_551 [Methylobacteriaceae bacterium]|jgi:hypothetical protein|nr:hypothetical protein [Methylobacteriaceae bacterium]